LKISLKLHILDWEGAGLNYAGYELANFLKELTWDYTLPIPPYFRVENSSGLTEEEFKRFLDAYWRAYTGEPALEYPTKLLRSIEICGVLQNYFWLMIGALSLKFKTTELSIDLVEYIKTRARILEKDLDCTLWSTWA